MRQNLDDRDENGRPVGTGPVIAQTYVSVIDQLIKIQRASHHDTQNPQQDKKSQEKKCEEHLIVVQRDDHQLVQMNIGDPGHIFVLSWILDADAVTGNIPERLGQTHSIGVFIDKSRTIKTELEPILCTS